MTRAACADCGAPIYEANDLTGRRQPCLQCSSTGRLFDVAVHCTATLDARLQVDSKHNRARGRRPGREERFKDDFWRDGQRWTNVHRIIDRDQDWYWKIITDPNTGEEIYRDEGPLSEHVGHGSANKRRPASV